MSVLKYLKTVLVSKEGNGVKVGPGPQGREPRDPGTRDPGPSSKFKSGTRDPPKV